MAGSNEMIKAIKQTFPNIDWDRFEDIDRSLNFDLWYGTASEYFGEDKAEPLEHYEWRGFVQAEKDIEELLDPLPWEMWWDADCDYLTDKDPEDDEGNWRWPCQYCGEYVREETTYVDGKRIVSFIDDTDGDCCSGNDEGENENESHDVDYNTTTPIWVGGYGWTKINLRRELMFDETFKQVF